MPLEGQLQYPLDVIDFEMAISLSCSQGILFVPHSMTRYWYYHGHVLWWKKWLGNENAAAFIPILSVSMHIEILPSSFIISFNYL